MIRTYIKRSYCLHFNVSLWEKKTWKITVSLKYLNSHFHSAKCCYQKCHSLNSVLYFSQLTHKTKTKSIINIPSLVMVWWERVRALNRWRQCKCQQMDLRLHQRFDLQQVEGQNNRTIEVWLLSDPAHISCLSCVRCKTLMNQCTLFKYCIFPIKNSSKNLCSQSSPKILPHSQCYLHCSSHAHRFEVFLKWYNSI
jgi:hypothetical protein